VEYGVQNECKNSDHQYSGEQFILSPRAGVFPVFLCQHFFLSGLAVSLCRVFEQVTVVFTFDTDTFKLHNFCRKLI
jgi:hypothetical protein